MGEPMTNWLRRIKYLPMLKPYTQAFADELTPSQRNHLRVILNSPTKLEELRRVLQLPARRKPWLEKNLGKRGSGLAPFTQNGNGGTDA